MADTTSVISIDVQDEAFKQFNALFQKFHKEVSTLPGAWGNLDKAVKKTEPTFVKINELLKDSKNLATGLVKAYAPAPFKKIYDIVKQTNAEFKGAKTVADKFLITSKGIVKTFGTIAKSSFGLAKNIKDITLNIAKWAALGLFTLAAGGFGLDKLAQSASNQKREAGALGITTGQHQSAQVNFGRFGDADSIMQKILEAQTDPSKRWTLRSNGISDQDINAKNPAEILKQLLPNLADKFSHAPKGSEASYMHANGMDQFGDLGYMKNALAAAITGELAKLIKQSKVDDKSLNSVSTKTATAWQDFLSQLERAGFTIENLFKNHLAPLSGSVGKLSMAFVHAVDTVFKSGTADKWIKKTGDAIEKGAKYLTSDDFNKDVEKFSTALETTATYVIAFGKAVAGIMDFLGITPEKDSEKGDNPFKRFMKGNLSFSELGSQLGQDLYDKNNPMTPAQAAQYQKYRDYTGSRIGKDQPSFEDWQKQQLQSTYPKGTGSNKQGNINSTNNTTNIYGGRVAQNSSPQSVNINNFSYADVNVITNAMGRA